MISYSQNFEDALLERVFRKVDRGFYLDIGAQDPDIDSVSKHFFLKGWRGVHVEPVKEYAEKLEQARPGDTVIQKAVSKNRENIVFYSVIETGLSTKFKELAQRYKSENRSVEAIEIEAITLDEVFESVDLSTIHWMKIDVEGSEEDVIGGWKNSKSRPWVLIIESTAPLTQVESHKKWEPLVIEKGYSFVYFDGLNRFYVHENHLSTLRYHFESPINVFDDVSLSGTASNAFAKQLNMNIENLTTQNNGYVQDIANLTTQNNGYVQDIAFYRIITKSIVRFVTFRVKFNVKNFIRKYPKIFSSLQIMREVGLTHTKMVLFRILIKKWKESRNKFPFNSEGLSLAIPLSSDFQLEAWLSEYYKDHLSVEPEFILDSKFVSEYKSKKPLAIKVFNNSKNYIEAGYEAFSHQVTNDWVLRCDADELFNEDALNFSANIASQVKGNDDPYIFGFHRYQVVYTDGQYWTLKNEIFDPARHTQWRLFDRTKVKFDERIHTPGFFIENINCVIAPENCAIYHFDWVFRDAKARKAKQLRYLDAGALEITLAFQVSDFESKDLQPLTDSRILTYLKSTKSDISSVRDAIAD